MSQIRKFLEEDKKGIERHSIYQLKAQFLEALQKGKKINLQFSNRESEIDMRVHTHPPKEKKEFSMFNLNSDAGSLFHKLNRRKGKQSHKSFFAEDYRDSPTHA